LACFKQYRKANYAVATYCLPYLQTHTHPVHRRPPHPPQKQLEDLEDASAELMLADDEEEEGGEPGVRMHVGAAFLHTAKDDAEARVEALTEAAQALLVKYNGELAGLQGQLAELKVVLYSRLGSGNINLEE